MNFKNTPPLIIRPPESNSLINISDLNNKLTNVNIDPYLTNEGTQSSKSTNNISISPTMQDKIVEQLLIQSGGVGLGVLLSLAGAIALARWLGVGSFITKCLEQVESGTQSLKALTEVLNKITEDLKDNHTKYIQDHEDILEEISEVKEIIKTDVLSRLKDIERSLSK